MVIDAVMWFAEADMMRLRISLLDPLVDTFVVVEADRTHQGDLKPFVFPDDLAAHPKVVYRQVTLTSATAWGRENEQRRAIQTVVASLEPDPDTLVVMSDCDEIWDERLLTGKGIRAAAMDFRLFSLFWRYPKVWAGSIAGPWSLMGAEDWQRLRDRREAHRAVPSGWHFSWMGDDEFVRHKQRSFAHTELADHDLTGPTTDGMWVNGQQMTEVEDGLPEGLAERVPASWLRRRVS